MYASWFTTPRILNEPGKEKKKEIMLSSKEMFLITSIYTQDDANFLATAYQLYA